MAPPPQAPTAPASRAALRIVPWLFAASGCAALVYQLVWFQQLALVIGASTPSAAVPGGAFVGVWCLRAHFRTAFFAAGRGNAATFGDLVFAVAGACLCVLMFAAGMVTLANAFSALTIANVLGVATMHLIVRRMPTARFDRGFRACYRRLGARLVWSLAGVMTTNLQAQGIVLLVAVVAGPAAYAPIAAMLVFFVPLRLLWSAVLNFIQPRFAAHATRGDYTRVWRICVAWSLAHGLMTFAYGACLYMLTAMLRTPALEGSPVGLQIGRAHV